MPTNPEEIGGKQGTGNMRVGIIGLGYRLAYLARVFTAARSDFEIVGYVDPAPAGLP